MRFLRSLGLFLLAGTTLDACNSHQENVCQDIGDCAQGGSSDWIAACEDETNALQAEAASAGCRSEFDAYFTCADSNYSCQGATAQFPRCADRLAALDTCLAGATVGTSCVKLRAAEATCSPAADASTDIGTPPACTTARDCQAQCYLAQVANVCAPQVDDIQRVTACAASCPP